jgi:hypothetical protein
MSPRSFRIGRSCFSASTNWRRPAITLRNLAVRKVEAISEAEMIAIFLKTELFSDRFRQKLERHIQEEKIDRRIIERPDWNNASENAIRRDLLGVYRGYEQNRDTFSGFPSDVRWERARISRQELERVQYINWDYWLELTDGTRMAIDGARNVLAGKVVYDVSSDGLMSMAMALRQGAQFPPLILVAKDTKSHLVVLEGHARLTAYLIAPECIPAELEVILGYSERMTDWLDY